MPEWSKRAVVVVHGMGMHQRGATPRSLVESLRRTVGAPDEGDPDALREPVPLGQEPPPVPLRLRRPGGEPADVYEIYWAPLTSRKTKARSVLGWLLKQTFLPGKALRAPSRKTLYDLAWMAGALITSVIVLLVVVFSLTDLTHQAYCHLNREGKAPQVCPQKQTTEFTEESGTVSAVSGEKAALEGTAQLGAAALNLWTSVTDAFRTAVPRVLGEPDAIEEAGSVAPVAVFREATEVANRLPLPYLLPLAAILWISVQVLQRLVGFGRGLGLKLVTLLLQLGIPAAMLAVGAPYWSALAAVVVIAILTATLKVAHRPEVTVAAFEVLLLLSLVQVAPPVLVAFVWILALAAVFFGTARRFLAEFIGDVQVYTTLDELDPFFARRDAILDETEEVFALLERRGYQEIALIGHSLGSVVALDAMTRLAQHGSPLLGRIDAVVTFGTALEKVKYFFLREADPYARLARSAEDLEAAMKTTRDQGDLRASAAVAQNVRALEEGVSLAGATSRSWVNLWYANDVVANPITTFDTATRRARTIHWDRGSSPDVAALLASSRDAQVLNVGLGFRAWPLTKIPWPHSDYWSDDRVLRVLAAVALPA